VESNLNLYRTLDVQSATSLDVDGSGGSSVFTLISSASDDSRIAALPAGASITGDLVFQKYFTGGKNYWRHISSAVLGASVADLQGEMLVSGFFTGNNNGTGGIHPDTEPSLYYYDNTIGLSSETMDDRWVNYPSSSNSELFTTTGTVARGYAAWQWNSGSITYDLTGSLNQGSIDFNPSGANEGWNLLGNPYPSDIDWDNAGWTKSNIVGNAVYVWDGLNYWTWNGSAGTGGFTGLIAKGQGFWIMADNASVGLTATESVKTSSEASTYRTFTPETTQLFEINVSASGYYDQAIIQFLDTASFNYDIADAPKMSNLVFNLSTLSADAKELSINALAGDDCSFAVPVSLTNTWEDQYTLNWNVSRELLDMYQISMEDQFTSETYNIHTESNGFTFAITSDAESAKSDRFVLSFTTNPVSNDYQLLAEQNCEIGTNANLTIFNSQFGVNYEVKSGQDLIETVYGTGDDVYVTIDSAWLNSGANLISVKASSANCSSTEGVEKAVEVEIIEEPVITFNAENNMLVNQGGNEGLWYLDGQLYSKEPSSSIKPDLYLGGVYTMVVDNDQCSLESNEYLVTAIEELAIDANVSVSPNPTTDFITVNLDANRDWNNSIIEVIDLTGSVFYQNKIQSNNYTINVKGYDSGIYILRIYSNEESKQLRFIKL
ncbi:MAG: T9SS type A sorting domain-containing protein, partial [Bacteroidota bacterium]